MKPDNERETVIQLSQKDAEFILSLLDNPPDPNPRLIEAFKLYQERVQTDPNPAMGIPE